MSTKLLAADHTDRNSPNSNPKPYTKPVFFNRGSVEPKGSASGIKGSMGLPVLSKKIKLQLSIAATRCVFSAPRTTGVAYSTPPDLPAGGEGDHCPLPKNPLWTPLSAFGLKFWPLGPQESPQKHGFCEQSKLLQRVPLHSKG